MADIVRAIPVSRVGQKLLRFMPATRFIAHHVYGTMRRDI